MKIKLLGANYIIPLWDTIAYRSRFMKLLWPGIHITEKKKRDLKLLNCKAYTMGKWVALGNNISQPFSIVFPFQFSISSFHILHGMEWAVIFVRMMMIWCSSGGWASNLQYLKSNDQMNVAKRDDRDDCPNV